MSDSKKPEDTVYVIVPRPEPKVFPSYLEQELEKALESGDYKLMGEVKDGLLLVDIFKEANSGDWFALSKKDANGQRWAIDEGSNYDSDIAKDVTPSPKMG